jgi:glycine cleavage system H protein
MSSPSDLKYSKTDEWVKIEGNIGVVGVSDYAQSQLSDVVYVEIKLSVGDAIAKNDPIASLESVKAAADVNAPVSGKVVAINEKLSDTPELVNSDPYGQAWMVKIELSDPDELKSLMDAADYDSYCQGRDH